MPYLSQPQLEAMGFRKLGKNVKISDRASVYDAPQMEIGDHVRIDDFCVVSGRIVFNSYIHIAPLCLVAGGEKGIVFDDFTGMAYGAFAFTQSDDYTGKTLTNPTVPDEYKNETKAPVHFKKHSGLGAKAIVFPGVTLAEGTAVGAMAMVVHSTEPWGIYVGIPARRVKERHRDLLELEKKFRSHPV
ncbi:MAG TPA: acyltransferase [Verrucomicrobiae bacterium]|nr:acyltransferase [Verrucomicrobiae bacterium]